VSESLAEKLAGTVLGADQEPHERLSDREFQVSRLLAQGRSLKEISAELSLSVKTISTYRTRIFEKLDVHNNVELARYAEQHGLIESRPADGGQI
jgi:two-component system invasion response regulator UvrY